jgi:hypothetical protein
MWQRGRIHDAIMAAWMQCNAMKAGFMAVIARRPDITGAGSSKP